MRSSTALCLLSAALLVQLGTSIMMFGNKRALDCKQKFDNCRGYPKCCNDTQCYWPEGWSMWRSGYCVECVKDGQACQRDSQCCEALVCDKAKAYHMDGECRPTKSAGGECYRDSQCQSGDCRKKDSYDVHGGNCIDI